jgi:hypothetical protein
MRAAATNTVPPPTTTPASSMQSNLVSNAQPMANSAAPFPGVWPPDSVVSTVGALIPFKRKHINLHTPHYVRLQLVYYRKCNEMFWLCWHLYTYASFKIFWLVSFLIFFSFSAHFRVTSQLLVYWCIIYFSPRFNGFSQSILLAKTA